MFMKSRFSKVIVIIGLLIGVSASAATGERYALTPFSLERLSQNTANELVALEDYRDSIVLVNFWATWCPPCVHELPSMQSLHDALDGRPFEILALNMGEDPGQISQFLNSFSTELKFPILLYADREVASQWRIRAMPTSMLVDKQGRLVSVMTGARDWDGEEMVNTIMPLLDE